MPATTRYMPNLRNAKLNAITTFVGNGGKLEFLDGAQPATGGAKTNVLATFTLGTPFAPAASGGVLLPTIPADVAASLTGDATWARLYKSDGTTIVADYNVGVADAAIIVNSIHFRAGVNCSIISWTISDGNP